MSDPESPTNDVPIYIEGHAVPFIYFDIAPAHGVMNGLIQVELAARMLTPHPDGTVEIKFVSNARLRCSPMAAKHLRDSLDSALKMLEQPQQSPVAAAKLN